MTPAEDVAQTGLVLIHATVPGRARVHVPGLKGAAGLKNALERGLSGHGGIIGASGSTATGNLLLYYEKSASVAVVMDAVARFAARYNSGRLEIRAPRPRPAPWHFLDAGQVLQRLRSSAQGLSARSLRHRLRRYGENILPSIPGRSRAEILIEQFKSLPVALLIGAAALSVVTGGTADAVVVLSVVALNAGIGYATETHAERAVKALSRPFRDPVAVVRDGRRALIPIERVVPGDLLDLRPGALVAADARVIEAQGLTINEATLTGESAPAQKSAERLPSPDIALADRSNIVYRGAIVTGGSGRAIVVATGPATEIGVVQEMIGAASPPETPLQRQLGVLGRQLTLVACGACGVVFLVGLLRGHGLFATLKNAIALAVAAVPEGLPTLATTTLALGIDAMRKRNVLVRRLEAVETLASVGVMCLDKTGTLTLNRMTVAEISCGGRSYRGVDGAILDMDDAPAQPGGAPSLVKLAQIVALCNETVAKSGAASPELTGSATEAALLRLGMDLGLDIDRLRRRHPLLDVSYRTEGQLFMTTIHATPGGRRFAAIKGSPESVLALCRFILLGGKPVPLTSELRRFVEYENARLGRAGQRVLAAAYADMDEAESAPPRDAIFAGLVGLADPLRPGVAELLRSLRRAGVMPVMITGDQKNTAAAIARALDLGNGDLRIVDSSEFTDLATMRLAQVPHVFARVTPGQKLEIVKALQRMGLVVAMTGDGVNDSPALKAADIGVAMGLSGSEAAREVAHIVLEDDNLASLAPAFEQGRTTYVNIRRAIKYLLATNMSEILLMLVAPAANLGQPLTPAQLLWINLITDVMPALALGVEPPHSDAMQNPPRPREDIVSAADFRQLGREAAIIAAGALAAYAYGLTRYGPSGRARTICFASVVAAQLLHALGCRSRDYPPFSRKLPPNRALTIVLLGSFAAQIAAMGFGPLRRLLGVAPIGALDVAVSLMAGVAPFAINESIKLAGRSADAGARDLRRDA